MSPQVPFLLPTFPDPIGSSNTHIGKRLVPHGSRAGQDADLWTADRAAIYPGPPVRVGSSNGRACGKLELVQRPSLELVQAMPDAALARPAMPDPIPPFPSLALAPIGPLARRRACITLKLPMRATTQTPALEAARLVCGAFRKWTPCPARAFSGIAAVQFSSTRPKCGSARLCPGPPESGEG
ncbi:hypothetical protein C8Q79DRAFT_404774 [Trametes meyenii]|nr:hypothetical protein C8Q79DRAFT_404774 [Trametes meyenii]